MKQLYSILKFNSACLFLLFFFQLAFSPVTAQTQFWGMTSTGGTDGVGTIFKTDSLGLNLTVLQNLEYKNEGKSPYGSLFQASNGNIYGLTTIGGANGIGVLFKLNPSTNTYTVKYNLGTVPHDGDIPRGTLMQASNGSLYGLSTSGGNNGNGNIFNYNIAANSLTSVYDFGFTDGATPYGKLVQASDAKLYGLAPAGGLYQRGTLFQFDPITNQFAVMLDFDSATGVVPIGSLLLANDSNLYGMTSSGGLHKNGLIFKYNTSNSTYTIVADFDSLQTGRSPMGSLIQASDGMLYGMTKNGGTSDSGVIFQFNPANNMLIKKIDFDGPSFGSNPWGDLLEASDGKLYGMTNLGGVNGLGVVFQYDPLTNNYSKKRDLSYLDGINPYGSLMQATNGLLYGMTNSGGTNVFGTIFTYSLTTDSFSKIIDLCYSPNGNTPKGSLVKVPNGKLYGLNCSGGINNFGVLFECDPTSGTFTKKADLTGFTNGSLLLANNGKLYGIDGKIFDYDVTTNQMNTYYVFNNSALGINPKGPLMQASNGYLYGMTYDGGNNYDGVIFKFNPGSHTYIKVHDFLSAFGKNPNGGLVEYSDGNLYGMTTTGGTNGMGVIFQFNPVTNTYVIKYNFSNNSNGMKPYGTLLNASDGKLYGTTYFGGTSNLGVIFQYDPITNTYTKKVDFNQALKGCFPMADLIQASDGLLYGMTIAGGTANKGAIYKYDPVNSLFTKLHDFNGTDGSRPLGNLVEVSLPTAITPVNEASEIQISPNPSNGKFKIRVFGKEQLENASWELVNMKGELMQKKIVKQASELTIDATNLPKSLYLLKICTDKKTLIQKIVIE